MAKRKKTRTHKLHTPNVKSTTNPSPKSFVIKSTRGHHGQSSANGLTGGGYNCTSLNLLVKDFRKVMEPNTASNLKVNSYLSISFSTMRVHVFIRWKSDEIFVLYVFIGT